MKINNLASSGHVFLASEAGAGGAVEIMPMSRLARFQRFLSEEFRLCHLGVAAHRRGDIHYSTFASGGCDGLDVSVAYQQIESDFRAFLERGVGTMVIVPDVDPFDDNAASILAHRLYAELGIVNDTMIYDSSLAGARQYVCGNLGACLYDGSQRINENGLMGRDESHRLIVFAMSPTYDPAHPRYSPVFALVINDLDEVEQARREGHDKRIIKGAREAISRVACPHMSNGNRDVLLDALDRKVQGPGGRVVNPIPASIFESTEEAERFMLMYSHYFQYPLYA